MGLISCPDCGKKISENGDYCIFCGCPLLCSSEQKIVRIQIPSDITEGLTRVIFGSDIVIFNTEKKILWEGRQGETAEFFLDTPAKITVHLGEFASPVREIVRPGNMYRLVQVSGIHLRAVYQLTEIQE